MNEQHNLNNNPNNNDKSISDAFDERATRIAHRSPAGIRDVYRRVDRRRQRRRSLAGVGAVAVMLAGVGGLAIANQRGTSPVASPPTTGRPTPTTTAPTPTTQLQEQVGVAASSTVWRCLDPIDPPAGAPADGASYFNWCEPVSIDVGADPATALPAPSEASPATPQPSQTMSVTPTTLEPRARPESSGVPMTMPPEWAETVSITSGITYYVAQPGDSLASVAEQFGTTADEVASVNSWSDGAQHVVVAGEVVQISTTVTVIGPNLPPLPTSGTDPAIGQLAPAVVGSGFDGFPVGVDPFATSGYPKLVVVTAHWCPHCDAELPALQSLVDAGRLPAGLEIIAISSSESPDQPNWPASEWFASTGWAFPTLVDAGDDGNVAAQAFGVEGYPSMILLSADDVVLDRWVGAIGADEIENRIDAALS